MLLLLHLIYDLCLLIYLVLNLWKCKHLLHLNILYSLWINLSISHSQLLLHLLLLFKITKLFLFLHLLQHQLLIHLLILHVFLIVFLRVEWHYFVAILVDCYFWLRDVLMIHVHVLEFDELRLLLILETIGMHLIFFIQWYEYFLFLSILIDYCLLISLNDLIIFVDPFNRYSLHLVLDIYLRH